MKKRILVLLIGLGSATVSGAADYYRSKWFEYPDPTTMPRSKAVCVKTGSIDVPCPAGLNITRMCRATGCIGHAYKLELLRVTPTFVISGPETSDEALKRAVQGIAAVCAGKAIHAAKGAAALAPPEPASRISAGFTAGLGFFNACISTANLSSVAAGIANQLEFKIETPTHWAPL